MYGRYEGEEGLRATGAQSTGAHPQPTPGNGTPLKTHGAGRRYPASSLRMAVLTAVAIRISGSMRNENQAVGF